MTTTTSSGSYDLNNFIPQDWRGWATYEARLQRYEVYEGYYHNLAYHSIVTYSQALKTIERLYKHVRGVYNPINRLVESYVSKIWGGVLDIQEATAGAIPLESDNEALNAAVIQLWKDSQWGSKKSLATRYGAKCGDLVLKVVDDIAYQQVRLEAVDPAKVKRVERLPNGQIGVIEFEYYITHPITGKNAIYNELITPAQFRITLDNEPHPLIANGRGEMLSEWANEYGFVPASHVQHTDVGLGYGAPAAHGVLHKINELNDLASILNDGMRKQVNMPMIVFGSKVGSKDMGRDQSRNTNNTADDPKKDTMPALELPVDARAEFPAPAISIADGLQNIREILAELERDIPELALHRLRDSSNLTAPGVRSAYDDAIARYQEARGNYDAGLVEAQRMAVAIGGMRGYKGYAGFNLLSLENGAVDHQIKTRPVIGDTLSLNEKLTQTWSGMSANAPQVTYIEMGWSAQQAAEIAEATQQQRDAYRMTNPFQQQNELQPPNDPDMTAQDMFDARQNTAINATDLLAAQELLTS